MKKMWDGYLQIVWHEQFTSLTLDQFESAHMFQHCDVEELKVSMLLWCETPCVQLRCSILPQKVSIIIIITGIISSHPSLRILKAACRRENERLTWLMRWGIREKTSSHRPQGKPWMSLPPRTAPHRTVTSEYTLCGFSGVFTKWCAVLSSPQRTLCSELLSDQMGETCAE